jgi:predicted 3-demethylubiquinone-9 3-methyltransferase (glyoxalase superfamily)
MPEITPMLWFDTQSEDAANFYCSIFPNSRVRRVSHYGEPGPREVGTVLTVEFELDGRRFTALNGGPEFTFTEAISFVIWCKDQEEIDHYWDKLSEGGEAGVCGWLKDRFGVSWQVVPEGFEELITDADEGRRDSFMRAMLGMKKLDRAALWAAAGQQAVAP